MFIFIIKNALSISHKKLEKIGNDQGSGGGGDPKNYEWENNNFLYTSDGDLKTG